MNNYQTQGVILRRKNFFETDKMLWVYTRDRGSIKVIAKGARKTLSKLSGHVELFYLNNFQIVEGKNIDIVTSVNIIDEHQNFSLDRKLLNSAYYIAELICKTLPEEQVNIAVFDLLIETLSFLDMKNYQRLIYFFEFRLYCLLGLAPRLDKCTVCLGEIKDEDLYFNYEKGGIVCRQCGQKLSNNISLNKNDWKILFLIKTKDIRYLLRIKFDDCRLLILKRCIEKMRHQIIERELNCEKFIN